MTRDEAAGIVIARVLQREGGVKDIGDGQGVTSFGQTPAWLRQFGLPTPRTVEEAIANYRTWLNRTRLIGLCDKPDTLADATIDFAVNSGHPTAIRWLQKSLRIRTDGIYGPETQEAVDACDRTAVGRRVIAERLRFLGQLITGAPHRHARWAAGWLNRVAAQVEVIGT